MQIAPKSPDGARCVVLTCLSDGCADGYQFPKDDTKTHVCPLSTDFDVTFCPGGKGGETPAPTPPPTPAPTPSPTPAPTSAPTPTPTSTPQSIEERGAIDASNSSSHSGETGLASTKKPTLLGNPESEVAGDADVPVTVAPVAAANSGVVTTAGVATEAPTNEISVQNVQASEGVGAGLYVAGILCAVAMVAGTAIVAVRRKKAQLDALESKTPRPTTTLAGGGACIMITPNNNNNNVSVL